MLRPCDHEEAIPADGDGGIQEDALLALDANPHARTLTGLRQQGQLNGPPAWYGHLYLSVLADRPPLGINVGETRVLQSLEVLRDATQLVVRLLVSVGGVNRPHSQLYGGRRLSCSNTLGQSDLRHHQQGQG